MRVACKLLIGMALLQGAAYAQETQIDVVDGKISMTAQAVPLGRLLTLFGRAVGMEAKIKPGLGLENQNISVMFTGLKFNDAVRKIFEGRNLNYVVVQGKMITVTELGEATSASAISSSPTFSSGPAFAPPPVNQPQNPVQNLPATSPFGGGTPAPANANPSPTPASGPGMAPPPIGASNPLINPVGGGAPNPNPMGNTPPPPSQPSGPGAVGGTPGALPPGTIR
jgi:hypothetical protein